MYIASMFKIIEQSSQDICRFLIAKTVTPGLILGHQEGSKFNKETYLEIILFISTIAMLWGFFKYVHIFIVSYHVNVILNFHLLELSLVHFTFFVFFYTCTFLKSVIFKLIEIELSNSCCSNAYCVHFFIFFSVTTMSTITKFGTKHYKVKEIIYLKLKAWFSYMRR